MHLWYCEDDDYIVTCKTKACPGHGVCEECEQGPALEVVDGIALCNRCAPARYRLHSLMTRD